MLSGAAVEQYRRDGYYFPIDILSKAEVGQYRANGQPAFAQSSFRVLQCFLQ